MSPSSRRVMRAGARRAAKVMSKRFPRAVAKRALIANPYIGAGMAGGALIGYGAYRGIKAIRARRARISKRNKIGNRPSTRSKSKNGYVVNTDITAKSTRTLYVDYLTNILKGTGLDQRSTDRVTIKGFHIQMNLQSLLTTSKVVINFAIVVPKNAMTVSATEFFREYGTDRAVDFTTGLNFMGMMQTPINADQYHVLWRWRVRLGAKQNNTSANTVDNLQPTERSINKYVKINRLLNYETSATNAEADPIALCMWADVDFSTAGGVAVANAFQTQVRIIRYFKDASCC